MNRGDRRALVLGGGGVVCAVLLLRVLPWSVRSVTELRTSAQERVETLARARDVAGGAPAVRDSLARALGEIVALAPKLVDGRTAAEAQASLGGLVSFAAGRQRLRVARLDPLADSSLGTFGRVALRAELEGDLAGLVRFLQTIETGDPLLSVPGLLVQAPDPGNRSGPEALRIQATVVGLYLPRAGGAP